MRANAFARLLGEARPASQVASGLDVAERLAGWVGVFDALALSAAYPSIRTLNRSAPPEKNRAVTIPLADQFREVRAVLVKAITSGPDNGRAAGRPESPPRPPEAAPPTGTGYASYRRRHLELQRTMDLMIRPLRDQIRQALSRTSAPLRQLAALDAQWEQVLGPREQKLLASLPSLLERRFKALQRQHAAHNNDTSTPPSSVGGPYGFAQEFQAFLLAELNLRLEPATGLMEAFLSTRDTTST